MPPETPSDDPDPPDDRRGGLSLETRLLLAAAPAEPDRERMAALLAEDPDWDRLIALLIRERAALPFWRRVRPLTDEIESTARERIGRLAAASELRTGVLRKRLVESLETLDDAGVETVVLKGGALANTLYPDPGERAMGDIDLLVAPDRAEEARRALTAAGWRRDEEGYPEAAYRRHYHLPPLRDEGGSGAALEIHTGLLLPDHPFALDVEAVRRRAVTARVDGRPMRVPDPVDHLLYVCLHFAWVHMLRSGGWRTARDVAVLSGAEGFSWKAFADRVREVGAGPYAHWTLRLGDALAGVPSPAALRRATRPPLPVFLLDRLERHFAAELFVTEPACPSVRLRQALWLLATRRAGGRPRGARPWSQTDDFRPPPGSADTDGRPGAPVWSRALRHLLHWDRWRDYLVRILGSGADRG